MSTHSNEVTEENSCISSAKKFVIHLPLLLRVCLVHFAKMCKDVNRPFEVLNEVYLQNFFHRWVVNREKNLTILINSC